ncbi:MAG: manganese efflux pump MntP family protein [Paludibacteraceae bacterium]|nr:manganese efflux pump MntP family protein [Paludibacteraceae bacterium]MBO7234369.1 manganese efflux pump MntP family protein [Paludibacteraceae bacterium]MBO7258586.1 manganese efflux pump MntP family protein [Paludibacteraceae bacterium]
MDFLTILLIAVGLAADCFAVSVCKGIGTSRIEVGDLTVTSLLFGLFQGLMPLFTFLIGVEFIRYISPIDHWIAFALLAFIGAKMIRESKSEQEEQHNISTKISHTFLLAVATSIDALATGIVFVPYASQIFIIITTITLVSMAASVAGYLMGYYGKQHLHINVELIGGVILILMGAKILFEHLFLQ